MKTFTNLEQSKKLAEILPIESADFHWERVYFENKKSNWFIQFGRPIKSDDILPCWPLTALLDILPYPTLSKDNIGKNKTGWMVSVFTETGRYDSIWHDDAIDACYEMIIILKKEQLL